MPVIVCTGAAFVRGNYCLDSKIVSFDTAGLHLFIFCILEPYSSKDIELDLSHVISH